MHRIRLLAAVATLAAVPLAVASPASAHDWKYRESHVFHIDSGGMGNTIKVTAGYGPRLNHSTGTRVTDIWLDTDCDIVYDPAFFNAKATIWGPFTAKSVLLASTGTCHAHYAHVGLVSPDSKVSLRAGATLNPKVAPNNPFSKTFTLCRNGGC
jgi:hypothetical protein